MKPGGGADWTIVGGWYGFFFLAQGAYLPFWPLWLADWGLSAAEVGAYMAAAVGAKVVAGAAIPGIVDMTGAPRRGLAALAALAGLLFAAHALVETRGALLAVTLAAAAMLAGALPIADALSLRAAARRGFAYAPARGVGSAAFLAANLLSAAAVARYGADAALWWIAASFAPLVWLGLRHPGGAGAPLPRPRFAEAAALLRRPAFLLTMLAGASLQGSHAVLYTYGSIHWRAQGVGDGTIGALWATGVALEVALMVFAGRRLIAALGPAGAMALAGAAGSLRWSLMTTDPSLIWLWPLQALHAITFTAAFLGALAMVERAAPASFTATAQGLVSATAGGLAMAGAGLGAAWAYPLFGGGAYWIGAALSLTGLGVSMILIRGGPQAQIQT